MSPSPMRSWIVLCVMLLPMAVFGVTAFGAYQDRTAEIAALHARADQAATTAAQRAARMAELQALRAADTQTSDDWPGTRPDDSALLMQETVIDQIENAGMTLDQITPKPIADDLLRLGIRATGDIASVQLALFALEQYRPRLAVETLALRVKGGTDTLLLDAVILGKAQAQQP